MCRLLLLLSRHSVADFRRATQIIIWSKSPVKVQELSAKMCICFGSIAEALKESAEKFRQTSISLGRCLARYFDCHCVCSTCLPSRETVCKCVGGIILFLAVVICFPCACCWCVCRVIESIRKIRGHRDSDHDVSKSEYEDLEKNSDPEYGERPTHKIKNLLFYKNEIICEPEGDFIDTIHKEWFGDYKRLEYHHGYIQWLFPLFESGVNSRAQTLNEEERMEILQDQKARQRMLESYKLMLDFYGLVLVNQNTGEVERSANWEDRFHNLNRHEHNFLRISRILKCLGIFEFKHLRKSLVRFFIKEIFLEETLTRCKRSCMNFWIPTLETDEANEMRELMQSLEARKEDDGKRIEQKKEGEIVQEELSFYSE